MTHQTYVKVKLDKNERTECICYIILHAGFNLKNAPLPKESPSLLQFLLTAFHRGSEDVTLAFKPRKNRFLKDDASLKAERNEEIYERIDSTVLLSLLSYCSRSAQHIDEVIRELGS